MSLLLLDIEFNPRKNAVQNIGLILGEKRYVGPQIQKIKEFASEAKWVCGHNIVAHDLAILNEEYPGLVPDSIQVIDTLLLSPLLRPDLEKHKLNKDYQIDINGPSDPEWDAQIAGELLFDLKEKWNHLNSGIRSIFVQLLREQAGFAGFFDWLGIFKDRKPQLNSPVEFRRGIYQIAKDFCSSTDLAGLEDQHPAELAYCFSLIQSENPRIVTPSWLLGQFPEVQTVFDTLRARPCDSPDCHYCASRLSSKSGLELYFGHPSFRKFEGDGEIPLQEQVVNAALHDLSLLTVFPTGGGKSLAFQLPALMRSRATGALTVVISPLVSLMKDQVDVLKEFGIVNAVSINGMLSPLERSEAIKMVSTGIASLLYISPESLRSATILRLLTGRMIDRFVIDEAHCFSAWGQDFRVDYGFIGPFIRMLREKKMDKRRIPVSCFTATARPEVVDDILGYFKKQLDLDLTCFITRQQRKNLNYEVLQVKTPEEKFDRLLMELEATKGPAIIYASRVKTTIELAEKLRAMQVEARHYNGKMTSKDKKEVQDAFKRDEVRVIVATSAFGMGVDKHDVGLVAHYEISPSLENYAQEAGRAGRNKDLQAKCVVLFDENDLSQHFNILQGGKINLKDIDLIWRAIKQFKRDKISKSALELARKAGWEQDIQDLETRVRTAVNALEQAGYIKRLLNSPRIFADSMLANNYKEGEQLIRENAHQFGKTIDNAGRVLKAIMGKFRRDGETRVDYLADQLGIEKHELATILNRFKDIGILGDFKDLSAEINLVNSKYGSLNIARKFVKIEALFLDKLVGENEEGIDSNISLREINDHISENFPDCSMDSLRRIMEVWERQGWIRKTRTDFQRLAYHIVSSKPTANFRNYVKQKGILGIKIVERLTELCKNLPSADEGKNRITPTVVFSLVALKKRLDNQDLFQESRDIRLYEWTLLHLNSIDAIDLKEGFLIFYTRLTLERQEFSNQKQYTKDDFLRLEAHYQQKVEQIHIASEYAKKMLANYEDALQFSSDYFTMKYPDFLSRYFPGRKKKEEIKRPMTQAKYEEIFLSLSLEQETPVRDGKSQEILVAAGPGSGKTRVLVRKMASLLLLEDIHPRQFLMLAFSRPAAREFRDRLIALVGGLGKYVDIYTYHGFAFRLMGRMGDLERSENIVRDATEAIREGNIPLEMVAGKNVIVLDEFQDISHDEFEFLNAIRNVAGNPRIVAAGDDDQSIFEFRGASVKYMKALAAGEKAKTYFLTKNFRAAPNLVEFSNEFLNYLPKSRLKADTQLVPHKQENGRLKLVKYSQQGLIEPFCKAIAETNLSGSVGVLTATNSEAYFVASRLRDLGIPALLLASRADFQLQNLLELQVFTHNLLREVSPGNGHISNQHWRQERERVEFEYHNSADWPLCRRILDTFETESERKFRMDWLQFLRQARIEDFYHPEQGKVLVSTMHKVKGKEFDEVFLLLDKFQLSEPEKARAVYVALTRAKDALEIHTHLPSFDRIHASNLRHLEGQGAGQAQNILTLNASLEDIVLSHFKEVRLTERVRTLSAGDSLQFSHGENFHKAMMPGEWQMAACFSKKFKLEVDGYLSMGYEVSSVRVDHIVVWRDKDSEKRVRVVLPELELRLRGRV